MSPEHVAKVMRLMSGVALHAMNDQSPVQDLARLLIRRVDSMISLNCNHVEYRSFDDHPIKPSAESENAE